MTMKEIYRVYSRYGTLDQYCHLTTSSLDEAYEKKDFLDKCGFRGVEIRKTVVENQGA